MPDIFISFLYSNDIKLFAGYESRYDDFFEEWDIIHPGLVEFEERIIEEGKNTVAAIIGKSYVEKVYVLDLHRIKHIMHWQKI